MRLKTEERALYTDDGKFIKRLNCPLNKKWESLTKSGNERIRHCDSCQRNVLDITGLPDEQLVTIFRFQPDLCCYISKDIILDVSYGLKDCEKEKPDGTWLG